MFKVVDQWDHKVAEFDTREEAEYFCDRLQRVFHQDTAPKARVVEED